MILNYRNLVIDFNRVGCRCGVGAIVGIVATVEIGVEVPLGIISFWRSEF